MSERVAKRLRREARERGGLPKPKQFFQPFTVEIDGKETYVPRRQRRAVYRRYMTLLRKGKISLQDLIDRQNKPDERIKINDRTA